MKRRICAAALLTAAVLSAGAPAPVSAGTREVLVTDTAGLTAALADARAGDEIILREGTYENDKWQGKWAAFFADAAGTAEAPIILRSEDPEHPATICGTDQSNKVALSIMGDYWRIENLRVGEAQKGIVLDQSCYSIISGCEVFNTGSEGIHLRDNSAHCLVENCAVHDTGTVTPKYGEGIYIGSAIGTEGYGFACHYNTVRSCNIYRVAAECVDIKEFTYGTVIEDCTFDGSCISGENGANSFIEIKGNDCIIRRNTGHRNGCEKQLYGFDLYCPEPEWGQNARIYENSLFLDDASVDFVSGWKCSAQVFRNTVDPPECAIGSNGNRIMDVQGITLSGDADENGLCNAEDILTLQDRIHGKTDRHLSSRNADLNSDGMTDVFDLALLKRLLLSGEMQKPDYTVSFQKEEAGKWRACNGLGSHTVTFTVQAEPGAELELSWGVWDPAVVNTETGKAGKWTSFSFGYQTVPESGIVQVSADLPEDATRLALEVWGYRNSSGSLDEDGVVLRTITAR
ncbi:MAG: right-handed parallel beta-helix repeat-containing protein [Oscillospiraceae bacterium]|nr:right-handed parallel beta-helix repeat-containing protein [Oscillospiraceae bacterium]